MARNVGLETGSTSLRAVDVRLSPEDEMSAGPEKDDPTYEISCCVDPVRARARDAGGDVAAGVCRDRWQPDPGLRRQQPNATRRQRCVLQPRYGEGHRRSGWLQG